MIIFSMLFESAIPALVADLHRRADKKGGIAHLKESTDLEPAVVAALECVDHVVIFPEVRVTRLLERVRPAIYVKGGDYTADTLDPEERAALEKIGAQIRILPFEPGYSTSGLIERLKKLSSP